MYSRLIKTLTFFICVLVVCPDTHADEVRIAAASNFTAAMDDLIDAFENRSGHTVRVSYGSSGSIYAQLINGAPFDVFFSADQEKPEALEAAGLVSAGSRFTYAIGTLVLWSPTENLNLTDGAFLREGDFDRLALANPRLAPYGRAAMEVLEYLGLEESTRRLRVRGENIAQTFQFVETGNADPGFVALSQLLVDGELRPGSAWIIPAELYTPIRQDAVVLKAAEQNTAALEFMDFIRSPAASTIMQSYGYSIDNS